MNGTVICQDTHFNSIKVRLELHADMLLNISLFLFQFHKGAIRTKRTFVRQYFSTNFNSIKVRLEPMYLKVEMKDDLNFNSIKVRLELRHSVP